jgi:hypothetical protein
VPQTCHIEVAAGPGVVHMMTGRDLVRGSGAVIEDPAGIASRMMTEEWPYYGGLPQSDPDRIEPNMGTARRSAMARSTARAGRGASGTVTTLPPCPPSPTTGCVRARSPWWTSSRFRPLSAKWP